MPVERLKPTGPEWNRLAASFTPSHVLQSWEWGQFKSEFGWTPHYPVWYDESGRTCATAQVLQRQLPLRGLAARMSMLYAPKGPLLDWSDADLRRRVLKDLETFARRQGAIFIKIDPDAPLGWGVPGEADAESNPVGEALVSDLRAYGWRFSNEQVQFRNTVVIDLDPDEETLLANMKQKTRYNVRLAGRRGVTVRPGGLDDLPLLYKMYAETAQRDNFTIRSADYYQQAWRRFMKSGMAEPLIAEAEGEALAAVIIFRFAGTAWYLYGMSTEKQREKMPNYLLQWEAMRRAKAAGCQRYDLWGAPDEFNPDDSMWGVYRFKQGLGGRVERHIGAWDLPVRPNLYWAFTRLLPRLLSIMRRRAATGLGG